MEILRQSRPYIAFWSGVVIANMFAWQLYGRGTEMYRLQAADPKADLELAIQRKDLRFIGLGGYAGTVPGGATAKKLAGINGVKYVEGTGDDGRNPFLYNRYIAGVTIYVEKYNDLLAQHVMQLKSAGQKIIRIRPIRQ